MPDENKLNKLAEIHYVVTDCCNNCQHGQFKPGTDWGTCAKFTYDHLKHTGAPRQLSVNRAGRCLSYEPDPAKAADLKKSGFARFS